MGPAGPGGGGEVGLVGADVVAWDWPRLRGGWTCPVQIDMFGGAIGRRIGFIRENGGGGPIYR